MSVILGDTISFPFLPVVPQPHPHHTPHLSPIDFPPSGFQPPKANQIFMKRNRFLNCGNSKLLKTNEQTNKYITIENLFVHKLPVVHNMPLYKLSKAAPLIHLPGQMRTCPCTGGVWAGCSCKENNVLNCTQVTLLASSIPYKLQLLFLKTCSGNSSKGICEYMQERAGISMHL